MTAHTSALLTAFGASASAAAPGIYKCAGKDFHLPSRLQQNSTPAASPELLCSSL